MLKKHLIRALLLIIAVPGGSNSAQADWLLTFGASDFRVTPVFNDMQTFKFEITIAGDLEAGIYDDPTLVDVNYNVFGNLPDSTPSGFGAFNLVRSILGAEFYTQGSSLNFEIGAGADLSDGLQFSELVGGTEPIFVLNAREVDTGRYHPPIVELRADGTGRMQNSNNFGGINPSTEMMVDVDFGEEYITDLAFTPADFTMAVPEPSSVMILGLGLLGLHFRRKRLVRVAF